MGRGDHKQLKKDFERVYTTYFPRLVRFAAQYVGVQQEAENIVQNVFLNLLENAHSLDEIQNINAYLFRSVKNRSLDFLKSQIAKQSKNCSIDDAGIGELTLKKMAVEQFDEFDGNSTDLEKKLAGVVESLPAGCKKIFIMSRKDGMTHSQIANKLGISASTVNNQINNAMRKLKEKFSHGIVNIVAMIVITALIK
jgi:RNA polymerase sigma-70 factor (ECF subfamily)